MVDIPPQQQMTPEQAYQRLQEWYQKQAQLKTLKQHEHLERVALSGFYFHDPREGTNRLDIGAGFDLKLQHGYNYKVNEEDLDNVKAADIKKHKLPWDDLFDYKPTLNMRTYRSLTEAQKQFVDQYLDIKPASPQLEIVPVADRAGQAAHAAAAEAAAAGNVDASGLTPATDTSDSSAFEVVLDPESAEPGQFYNDGESWWVLGEDIEWVEVGPDHVVEGGHSITLTLDEILEGLQAEAEAAKPKRGRGRPKKDAK